MRLFGDRIAITWPGASPVARARGLRPYHGPPRARRLLVIGSSPSAWERLHEDVKRHNGSAPDVVGFLAQGGEAPFDFAWSHLGPIEELDRVLTASRASEVALCLDETQWRQSKSLVDVCTSRHVPVWIPIAVQPNDGHAEPQESTKPTLRQRLKRSMDLAGAISGLLFLGPTLLAAALAVLVADGRPVFFRQYRAGVNGRPFRILKFRTMRRDADGLRGTLRGRNEIKGQAAFKMKHDPRVTRLGQVLRRTSIDELPQLWNVLLGDMSLVGPRPHPYDDVAGYAPWHLRRLAVKPGITGLWQVELRNDPDFDRAVQKDLEYIALASPWLDLKVMLKTIPVMLRGTGQ